MKTEMTRKEFLHTVVWALATGAGATLLAGCGGGEEQTQTTEQKTKPAVADPCGDVSALTERELTMRNVTLKYVPQSTVPGEFCDNCKFWEPPSGEGEICGGCTLIEGPIHPKGYCTSWFVRET